MLPSPCSWKAVQELQGCKTSFWVGLQLLRCSDASEKAFQKILEEYKDVFANELGVIHPLNSLLCKYIPWKLTAACSKRFEQILSYLPIVLLIIFKACRRCLELVLSYLTMALNNQSHSHPGRWVREPNLARSFLMWRSFVWSLVYANHRP